MIKTLVVLKMKKVSVNFDRVLSLAIVQEYIAGIMGMGIEVHILTSREPENGVDFIDNRDIWDTVNQLAIPLNNVRFTSYSDKSDYLVDSGMLFHLDDDQEKLDSIGNLTMVEPVNVNEPQWRDKCDKILNL